MKAIRFVVALTIVAGLLVSCAGPGAAPASKGLPKAADGTLLRKIQDRGKIVVGVKYDVPMFGLLNPSTNKVEGFDVDVAKEITNYIFGNPDAIEFKEAV